MEEEKIHDVLTPAEYQKLKYGMVISRPGRNEEFLVLHVQRDPDTHEVLNVGLIPSLSAKKAAAEHWHVVSRVSGETVIEKRTLDSGQVQEYLMGTSRRG